MIRKDIKQIIEEYFFVNPTKKLRVRQIEKILKSSLPSVIRYCKELEKESILKKVEVGNVTFYTADRSSDNYLIEKKLFNIKQLYESNLIDYLKIKLHNPTIIVFGSYAKGEDIESSDIDLYIETTSKLKLNLQKFEKILKRKIQVFIFKKIKEVPNPHLANNIINGIVLNAFLEVF